MENTKKRKRNPKSKPYKRNKRAKGQRYKRIAAQTLAVKNKRPCTTQMENEIEMDELIDNTINVDATNSEDSCNSEYVIEVCPKETPSNLDGRRIVDVLHVFEQFRAP